MLVYDLEIGKHDWLIGAYNGKEFTQIHNDLEKAKDFYEKNKNDIWVGHNSDRYDVPLTKLILLGQSPENIKEFSDQIINQDKSRELTRKFRLNTIQLYNWDTMRDRGSFFSLKETEGYFGLEIKEGHVDWNSDEPWDDKTYEIIAKYNQADLLATWREAIYQLPDMKIRSVLLKEYNHPKSMFSWTNAKVCAEILESDYTTYPEEELNAAFDVSIIPLKIEKYTDVVKFFTHPDTPDGRLDYKARYNCDIAKVPHTFAIGGIHGAIPNFIFKGTLWLIDVASYYPNMMINFNLTPRSIRDENSFKDLVAKRINAKHKVGHWDHLSEEEKKANPLTDIEKLLPTALKLPINTVSGCMKSKYSKLYDERNNNWMCISGQLLMVDLIEKLEPYCQLVQSNTDGLIIIPFNHKKCDEAIQEWMDRTGLVLEKTVAKQIYQKDVNNYILEDERGYPKVKGGYVAQYWNWKYHNVHFRRNLEIIDVAMVDYILHDTPIEDTVFDKSRELVQYQIVKKLGGMYTGAYHEIDGKDIPLENRVNRIFPAKDKRYGKVKKKKWNKDTLDSLESTPDNALVINDNIEGKTIGDYMDQIDMEWYVNTVKGRIIDYVLEGKEKTRGKNYSFETDWENAKKKLGKE